MHVKAGVAAALSSLLLARHAEGFQLPTLHRQQPRHSTRSGSMPHMGLQAPLGGITIAAGAEIILAAYSGHLPCAAARATSKGVAAGAASLALSLFFKEFVDTGAGGVAVGAANFLTIVMLLVRVVTIRPDARYVHFPASMRRCASFMLLARVVTIRPDARYVHFPASIAHPSGCTRVAPTKTNVSDLGMPKFKSSPAEVQEVAREWLALQPRTKIFRDEPGYVHAQALSFLFGFPDNLGIRFEETPGGGTQVWAQGELRVGEGDLGVNYKRVKALLLYLQANCT
ncbi:hypothetical protein JKP88DRAFT_347444 [Tribonema minus]|uniref:DUF1499 domain-containing protein n=1 Tax=Tribonema minus TaxID=303371 RepID=A0A835ZGQ5_9STRA|nr:hypothetical protein JKP88DRAFT_347444 [Tribonema minus]